MSDDAIGLELCDNASSLLRAAGFQLFHTSLKSEACYYELPGRPGLMRVATHKSKRATHRLSGRPVCARITFSPNMRPRSADGFRRMVALAVGQFMLAEIGKE
jgi:hypothetical protein